VLHQDEGHAGGRLFGDAPHEGFEGPQPAGGSADADHGDARLLDRAGLRLGQGRSTFGVNAPSLLSAAHGVSTSIWPRDPVPRQIDRPDPSFWSICPTPLVCQQFLFPSRPGSINLIKAMARDWANQT
jgi:hypothetical protein